MPSIIFNSPFFKAFQPSIHFSSPSLTRSSSQASLTFFSSFLLVRNFYVLPFSICINVDFQLPSSAFPHWPKHFFYFTSLYISIICNFQFPSRNFLIFPLPSLASEITLLVDIFHLH